MSEAQFRFGSPAERSSTTYLEHVAGFEVADTAGAIVLVTPADLEGDSDVNPLALRDVLDGDYDELKALSSEFLLRNFVVPNLPLGFYGHESGDPVILGATIEVHEPGETDDPLEFAKADHNSVSIDIIPTLGRLASVSYIRDYRLGGYGIDWLSSYRQGCNISLFGGALQANIEYTSLE